MHKACQFSNNNYQLQSCIIREAPKDSEEKAQTPPSASVEEARLYSIHKRDLFQELLHVVFLLFLGFPNNNNNTTVVSCFPLLWLW